jgi:hypothetical protein
METRLRQRLAALREEFEKGKKTAEDLENQAVNVRTTLLRISGAIQVLQEELEGGDGGEARRESDAHPPPAFHA